MKPLLKFGVALVLFTSFCVVAAADLFPFQHSQDEQRFNALTHEVRCMVCQNQSVADSNASFANDVRQKIYQLLSAGKTDAEIKAYLSQRYGDYVLFKPPLKNSTVLLWLLPLIIGSLGCVIAIGYYRANREATS